MRYTLMHKRLAVAELDLDDETGFIKKINTVYEPKHLPIGISYKRGIADRAALNTWWTDRSIPASRSGIRAALETLNVADTKMLLVRCFGLSLSDQYWIRPQNEDITWDKINFFDNAFSEDMGNVLFGGGRQGEEFDFSSPDNTSDGCLKKRWKIIDGKRCLMKGGSKPFCQQPFNEVIASGIMDLLFIPHVRYDIIWDGNNPYSECEDFVTVDTELVSAWRIMQTQKKDNQTSVYQHFRNCCEGMEIQNVAMALDRMLVLDYLIANEDRHLNNFGLIRNAETLEWLGFAPIFDSGSSLGFDKSDIQIKVGKDVTCKPFKKSHEEQLKLVTDFSWIDFEKLKQATDIVAEVFGQDENRYWISKEREQAIQEGLECRIQTLQEIAQGHQETEDSIEGDVEENVAADYTMKM